MIPRTFPSVEINGVRAMSVKTLGSVAGLQQWIDYIPIKDTADPGAFLNTYNGSMYASEYAGSGQAWVDYVPVYVVTYPDNKKWTSDNDGYIPLFGLGAVPSTGFSVLDATNTPYAVPIIVLDGSGTPYSVSNFVLDGSGTSYDPL